MRLTLILPVMGSFAVAIAGCNNALNQPQTSQTPQTVTPTSPKYGQAGGPLVPANYPPQAPPKQTAAAPPPGPWPPARIWLTR
jgi:hypothetical protein